MFESLSRLGTALFDKAGCSVLEHKDIIAKHPNKERKSLPKSSSLFGSPFTMTDYIWLIC
jgi:hypothetical protein